MDASRPGRWCSPQLANDRRESLWRHGTRGDRSRVTRLCLFHFLCRRQPAAIGHSACCVVSTTNPSFHHDCCSHPRMDTALKVMIPFGQACDLELAALQDARSGHRDSRKTAGALGNYFPAWTIEGRYKTATELCNLSESVRLTALVDCVNGGSFLDCECVRFEVPVRVRSPRCRFGKQRRKRCGRSKGDVLAEIRADRTRGIEGGRITLV